MSQQRPTLFDSSRLTMDDSLRLTIESMREHGPKHDHWAFAWSGGKDSTATLTVIMHLIAAKKIPAPKRLTVCYADTRMEITPLAYAAQQIIATLKSRRVDVRTVMAPLDDRFFVYMLGRGVPPPNNNTLRWCTSQIKVEPMQTELRRLVSQDSTPILMITGVRLGESAARDDRIALSCSRDGAECGQGWYQRMTGDGFATLAPLIHWRVCHVWDWLRTFAPTKRYGRWPTELIADAYGGDEAEEINARTGCICCPLASKDTALDAVIAMPLWSYLAPLKRLRAIYRALREPRNRLRKPGGESRKDGTLSRNQHRMGPLTMEARRWALAEILAIQAEVNAAAEARGTIFVDILNTEERLRIEELIEANTWPNRWTGDEPIADEPYHEHGLDGLVQLNLLAN
mgnify:CR=1 FL=1